MREEFLCVGSRESINSHCPALVLVGSIVSRPVFHFLSLWYKGRVVKKKSLQETQLGKAWAWSVPEDKSDRTDSEPLLLCVVLGKAAVPVADWVGPS